MGTASLMCVCPVCGSDGLLEKPRSVIGSPSYEVCMCCGFEFGYHDDSQGYTYRDWRTRWIGKGTRWCCEDIEPRPLGWDAEQQLMNLAELN